MIVLLARIDAKLQTKNAPLPGEQSLFILLTSDDKNIQVMTSITDKFYMKKSIKKGESTDSPVPIRLRLSV